MNLFPVPKMLEDHLWSGVMKQTVKMMKMDNFMAVKDVVT